MSDHRDHETDILSDEQIDEGPASAGDRPWRERVTTAQQWQDLVAATRNEWRDVDDDALERASGDHDAYVEAISASTDVKADDVERRLDQLA